jgi:hypothetical protein
MEHKHNETDTLFLKTGEGRVYNCGLMMAIFKADENETANKYSISEWWLEPNSDGLVHTNTKTMTKSFMVLKALHQYS